MGARGVRKFPSCEEIDEFERFVKRQLSMCTSNLRRNACAILLVVAMNASVLAQTTLVPRTPAVGTVVRRDVDIPASRTEYVKDSFTRLFQNYLRADVANARKFELWINNGRATLEFRTVENKLRIEGTEALSRDIANLVTTFAIHRPEEAIRLLPLRENGQDSLSKFSLVPAPLRINSVQFASAQLVVPPQESPNPLAPMDTTPKPDKVFGPTSLPLPQFEGVQIEMLPEIDAIILRGRDQQLTDLAEIIKRLDDASRLTRPEIEIVPLQHAGSEEIAKVITGIQEKLTGTIQGRVSITPLGKPNSLLLIGWGEAIVSTKDLIAKLDQPASPDAQFEVIQLQHASATELQTQLQTFFKNRVGLAPIFQSMVDNRTNAIIVHAPPRDLLEIRKLIAQLDVPRGTLMQQSRVFPLRHSLAADVAKSLQQALSTTANGPNASIQLLDREGRPLATSGTLGASQITVNERNNSILVSCAPDTLPLIEQLIEQLDTPGMVAKIKIFPVKNGDATGLVETLRSLLPAQATGNAISPQLSSAPDETALLPLRFTVDTRGNNIIVIGSEGDLKIVEALILRLDESDKMQRKSTVYQLKNSPAVDVALAINEFLRSKRQVEIAAPGVSNPFEQIEKEVVVVPEPVQNKLILSATPRYYDEISRLIEQLDQQPPQVMIQVMIAEITLSNTDEFGVEVGLQDSVLFDRSLLGALQSSNTPGYNFNNNPLGNSGSDKALANSNYVGGQGISNFSVGRNNQDAGFGGLVLSASSENVSFLLRALQETRRLEVLSRPQVLTLDNQQAFIQVGQFVPRITNSNITQFGVTNGLADKGVGLIIGVTPRISPEGIVVMEIDAEKSKVGPENEGIPVSITNTGTILRSPRIDTINAQATVSAADGETIILGGLISRSSRTEHRQVPWLGSLPILKYLFSYDLNQTLRTELVIILTPHVVRSQGDMERLKQAEFARMSWCEADIFEVHGNIYSGTDVALDCMKQEYGEVVYPDTDPRGTSTRSAPQTPSVGPPLTMDPARFQLDTPELILSPVEPAVFQASRAIAPGQPSNGPVVSAGMQQASGSGRSQAIPTDYSKPFGTPSYANGVR